MKKKKKIVISSKIIIIIMAVCLFISLVINIYLFSIKKAVNMLDENIVFFGDSITEVYKVDEFFPKRNVINSGIIYNIKFLQLTLLPLDGKEEGSR